MNVIVDSTLRVGLVLAHTLPWAFSKPLAVVAVLIVASLVRDWVRREEESLCIVGIFRAVLAFGVYFHVQSSSPVTFVTLAYFLLALVTAAQLYDWSPRWQLSRK